MFDVVYVCVCCPGVVCEGGGHLPVDQLPVRLPVCDRVRSCELLHHSGGDEEDEEGEGQHGLLQQTSAGREKWEEQRDMAAIFHCVSPSSGQTETLHHSTDRDSNLALFKYFSRAGM